MNDALEWFTRIVLPGHLGAEGLDVYYLMLPLKIGLADSVRPSFWGFEMSPTVGLLYGYVGLAALLRARGARLGAGAGALGTAVLAMFYYFGTTGVPWPAFMLLAAMLAYQAGGCARLPASRLRACSSSCSPACGTRRMVSVELSAVGVLLSFLLGVGARHLGGRRTTACRRLLRPICDTLQTMPIFVFLIPAIMVFLVGEFTALIAIVMYAIVPSIRYTEHGIRNVPAEIVEAAARHGNDALAAAVAGAAAAGAARDHAWAQPDHHDGACDGRGRRAGRRAGARPGGDGRAQPGQHRHRLVSGPLPSQCSPS